MTSGLFMMKLWLASTTKKSVIPRTRALDTATKNGLLGDLADRIDGQARRILDANSADLARAEASGLQASKIQRLRLDEAAVARSRLAKGVALSMSWKHPPRIDGRQRSKATPASRLQTDRADLELITIIHLRSGRRKRAKLGTQLPGTPGELRAAWHRGDEERLSSPRAARGPSRAGPW